MKPAGLLRLGVVVFLVFPFLALFFMLVTRWSSFGAPDWSEIAWAARNSFWQAFFSATASLAFGFWGAAGLLTFSTGVRRRWRALLEILLLIPNFLPPIFTLIAALNLVDPFPMGRPGVILVHTAMNWGLTAVLLTGMIESKIGGVAELAWIEGASRWNFLVRGLLPMLAKDLALLWTFVFAVCFGSFAVPLTVGGGKGTTLEVLIYERIRLSTDWSQAITIATLQSVFLFVLALAAARGRGATEARTANLRLFQSKSGLIPILGFTALFLLGYLQGLPSGLQQLSSLFEFSGDLGEAVLGSFLVALSTGVLCLIWLVGIAALVPSRWFEKFMSGYAPPSQALAAFVFLVIGPNAGAWVYLKLPIVLTLLTLPILWRVGWQGALDGLRRQREIAWTLGVRPMDFLVHVLWPQLSSRATTLAGIAAVWAVGDFAVSRILAHRDLTLAMMIETLMTGYRLGLATILGLGLLIISVACFLAMKGLGRVLGRKPVS